MATRKPMAMMVTVAVVAIVVGYLVGGGSHTSKSKSTTNTHQAFDPASGDTVKESINRFVAELKSIKGELHEKATQSAQDLSQNKAEQAREINALREKIAELGNKIEYLQHNAPRVIDSPLDKNNQDIDQERPEVHKTGESELALDLDASSVTPSSGNSIAALPTNSHTDQAPVLPSDREAGSTGKTKAKASANPLYEIPDGATVANTILLSPLIGEVPVGGALKQPAFPFKAMISYKDTQNMFAANNVALPQGIVGSVIQGCSVGSMSLGCTRAYVTKLLFVFDDGHFVSFPKDKDSAKAMNAKEVYPTRALGYLSNVYNNPCIAGTYITDAPKVIGSLASLGAVSGAGSAIADSQTQNISDLTSGKQGKMFTGSLGKYALGYAIGNGSQEALNWYKARVSDIFDAIFVPSSANHQPTKLIFNVTQTIKIDLNQPTGRLYEGTNHFSGVDHSVL